MFINIFKIKQFDQRLVNLLMFKFCFIHLSGILKLYLKKNLLLLTSKTYYIVVSILRKVKVINGNKSDMFALFKLTLNALSMSVLFK